MGAYLYPKSDWFYPTLKSSLLFQTSWYSLLCKCGPLHFRKKMIYLFLRVRRALKHYVQCETWIKWPAFCPYACSVKPTLIENELFMAFSRLWARLMEEETFSFWPAKQGHFPAAGPSLRSATLCAVLTCWTITDTMFTQESNSFNHLSHIHIIQLFFYSVTTIIYSLALGN